MEGPRQTNESIEVPESQNLLTYLSENLAEGGEPFLCRGTRPWLGEEQGDGCPKPLHGTLRGATNVYFPIVKSAIYLPRPGDSAPPKLRELLDTEEVQRLVRVTMKLNPSIPALCSILREEFPSIEASGYSDESIEAAVTAKFDEPSEDGSNVTDDDPETSFRRAEYDLLRSGYQSPDLIVRTAKVSEYLPPVQDYFSRIQLVQKLRETRAFTGFSRLKSKDHLDWDARNLQLWRCKRARKSNWLPAYTVYGEGLYFELDENHLSAWEQHAEVISRISPLNLHYEALQRQRAYRELAITPRFALLHTLAHLLINQLVFDCGYSSASLRERLYVSNNPDAPMAGLLIYTASGDSEGTMGGLVRMGQADLLEQVVLNAVRNASWCSSDPVCMELGAVGGQGPDSCNLAACHSCALLPETSCEHFNRFLDRWTVVGDPQNPNPGFFSGLLEQREY